jgi:hypothetical protein
MYVFWGTVPRVMDSWWLKKMLKVPALSFNMGIARGTLSGPHFLPPRLSEAVYENFLRNVLPKLLYDDRVSGTMDRT